MEYKSIMSKKNIKKTTHIIMALLISFPAFAEVQVNSLEHNTSIQQADIKKQSAKQEAEIWGLSSEEYLQYIKLMHSTPSGTWWKDLDPPQVLGMNAKTNSERMKYARIDAKLDHDRAMREIGFQHAFSKAYKQMYPNDKPIGINVSKKLQSDNIRAGDQYYLFTTIEDPEGDMIATKLIDLMKTKSDVTLNIFFVGKVSFWGIQKWARGNNLPTHMKNMDRVTLNHNKKGRDNMLKNIMNTTNVTLPLLVRFRNRKSEVVSLTSL